MFIIYGSKSVTSVVDSGEFACPGCGGATRPFLRKAVHRYFTVFFLPLFPTGKLGSYVECRHCGGEFDERVLLEFPEQLGAKNRADQVEHLRRVMVHAALADGPAGAAEVEAIRAGYREASGRDIPGHDVDRELNLARLAKAGLADYPRTYAGPLDEPSKDAVVRAALGVLVADGPLTVEERTFLEDVAFESGLPPARLREILAEAAPAD